MPTTSKYALLDKDGSCVSVALWDGVTAVDFGGLTPVKYDPAVHAAPGDATSTNEVSLRTKLQAAVSANINDITQAQAIVNNASFTTTTRDNAIRELARQMVTDKRELTALIKIVLRDLSDTSGT